MPAMTRGPQAPDASAAIVPASRRARKLSPGQRATAFLVTTAPGAAAAPVLRQNGVRPARPSPYPVRGPGEHGKIGL
jgi:hypothetical protein